jgi:dihydroorotase-like cyclic amidohydrolase
MPGVETLGALLYSEGVATGRITLGRFVELLCAGPARIFGFARKGRLQIGYDADVAVLDPHRVHAVDESRLHYVDGWSAFHGWNLVGEIKATFVRGQQVFGDGTVTGRPGSGRFVRPGATSDAN